MILEEIANKTRLRVAEKKQIISEQELKEKAFALAEKAQGNFSFPFEQALKREGMSYICEVKKASPSKGIIAADFPYEKIAREYEQAGAAAISVLTEPYYFQGADQYLEEIAKAVQIPVLRKDFTVDAYMIYEAKCMGAAAILLICAILNNSELQNMIKLADELGLSALVEAHTEEEVKRAIKCGGRIIGVNNRDLKTFHVDIRTSEQLRHGVPKHFLFVSESGIKTTEDVQRLKENGTDAVLIGEILMRCPDKKGMLEQLNQGPLSGYRDTSL